MLFVKWQKFCHDLNVLRTKNMQLIEMGIPIENIYFHDYLIPATSMPLQDNIFNIHTLFISLPRSLLQTLINFSPSMDKWLHCYNVWDEIAYPFPNFNGATVEVWEVISNFIPHLTELVITYPCLD